MHLKQPNLATFQSFLLSFRLIVMMAEAIFDFLINVLNFLCYAWVAPATLRRLTDTVAPPMGANEAPKDPKVICHDW